MKSKARRIFNGAGGERVNKTNVIEWNNVSLAVDVGGCSIGKPLYRPQLKRITSRRDELDTVAGLARRIFFSRVLFQGQSETRQLQVYCD